MKFFIKYLILIIICQLTFEQTTSTQLYASNGSDWTGLCKTGQSQSPIDITDVKGTCDNSMMINMVLRAEDVQTKTDKQNKGLISDGFFTYLHAKDIDGNLQGYDGYQLQVKSPSEHQIEGTTYDIELQFYHKIKAEFLQPSNQDQKTQAVVSILYNKDATVSSDFFGAWIPYINKSENFKLNVDTLLGKVFSTSDEYYSYQGSLTQPTCDENVNWYVFTSIQKLSQQQYNDIVYHLQKNQNFANFQGSNRVIQELNARTIKKGNVACEEQFIYFFSFFILYIFINYFIFKLL